MKCAALLMTLAFSASAQSPVDKPSDTDTPVAKKLDPKIHADAIKLVEVSEAKQRMQESLAKMVDESQKQMMDKCPGCDPEFGREWKKRFIERTNINDYVDVWVRVYERYFTDAEINELIALVKDKSKAPSAPLKEKLTAVMPALLADVMGDCAKIGAKLGAEIAAEIEREHPDYVKPPAKSGIQ